jgi:hypothetical protein
MCIGKKFCQRVFRVEDFKLEGGNKNMAYKDYLKGLVLVDVTRFPLTTQVGLSEDDQALIDAIALDQLREMIELEEPMTDRQKARLVELEEKHSLRMDAARKAGVRFTGEAYPEVKSDPQAEVKPESTSSLPQEEPYRGDPRFRLTDEQASRVAKGHREMMAMPNKPPIDLTKDD